MSIWKLVRLDFGRNPVHFGEVGIGLEEASERVRSDTLFSAWVSSYARLFGKDAIEALLNDFKESSSVLPFRISSTFVYRGNDRQNYVYYLPKLIQQPGGYPKDDLSFAKTYRKLNYLPLNIWQRWYQGDGFNSSKDAEELESYSKNPNETSGELTNSGAFSYTQAFRRQTLPKVSIDRTTRATNFYHTGLVQFAPSSGLYFLIEFSDESKTIGSLENQLKAALHLLGKEGLGGERSSGAGRFEIEYWSDLPETWRSIVQAQGNQYGLISLFWQQPISPSLLGDAQYILQERGGWIASPFSGRQLRRKMIRMFVEGSVFPQVPQGALANVTPNEFRISDTEYNPHPVYRNGIALSLPIRSPSVS